MKIAVYGIARNEEKNINEWFESSKNADYHLILDTGSSDNTVSIANDLGISVHEAFFSPWDESMAKNVAMSLLPKDIDLCILLDLDQRICTKNWKNILIKILDNKKYNILTNDLIDNVDFVNNNANKSISTNIHSRQNCYWHMYRPRLKTIIKQKDLDIFHAPITICNVPGNEERYVDRENVYLNSWEIEYQKLIDSLDKQNEINKITYFIDIVSHQAFNFFETDKIDLFFNKEKEYFSFKEKYFSILKSNSMDHHNHVPIIYNLDSRFIFARSLLYPESAEKYLNCVDERSLYYTNSIIKLDIINFWKNGTVTENIKNLNHFEKIDVYADSKTGKHKIDLAKKAYKYFTSINFINMN